MNKHKARAIIEALAQANPNASTELNYNTPFELLISVILSAQATDVSVNIATGILFAKANTPKQILALGENGLKQIIKSIGLYNTKAKNIIKACKMLIDDFHGELPHERCDLEKLPGVGRKTANIILNIVFQQPTIAVDTHVFRVCNRTKLAVGKTPTEVENKLLSILPQELISKVHHLLLLHGRYVCTARKPHCKECIIRSWCEYEAKTET